jgi:hypothetical protein
MAPTATLRDGEPVCSWLGFLAGVVLWKSTTIVSDSLVQPNKRNANDKGSTALLRKKRAENSCLNDPRFMKLSGSNEREAIFTGK